ncbi:class I SAM-dependent DNA methyltransferase [Aspergillus alliaceus]|uniref:class I SAM-dependent DNA methyltransferase n=1 Tax=Petromyces alliaceus TaxID=209559 RepID=UPI0012A52EBD|nr:S-adenosyl-L-methionine-dependent methyltransferase [Aspergillus alliaceus]KAB8237415.1 S-adenosyl-L-methionine-dependent methyltransferase [Aspergillus alliaceus]
MGLTIQETLASSQATSIQKPVQYVETIEAYNKWAEVYDTDGNFLQGLDTLEMQQLLPQLLDKVIASTQTDSVKLVDLGCGTGRNTRQLLKFAPKDTHIVGVDASPGMLDVARTVIDKEKETDASLSSRVSLEIYDLLQSPPVPPECSLGAVGVISTLVLEHIPVDQFFKGVAALMRSGGYFLLTNMHSEMGSISQAGFVDTATGTKIRPTSYSHTIEDVLNAAEKAGFDVEELDGERVRERKVTETRAEGLGKRAKKWIGITVWFGICFRKRL